MWQLRCAFRGQATYTLWGQLWIARYRCPTCIQRLDLQRGSYGAHFGGGFGVAPMLYFEGGLGAVMMPISKGLRCSYSAHSFICSLQRWLRLLTTPAAYKPNDLHNPFVLRRRKGLQCSYVVLSFTALFKGGFAAHRVAIGPTIYTTPYSHYPRFTQPTMCTTLLYATRRSAHS